MNVCCTKLFRQDISISLKYNNVGTMAWYIKSLGSDFGDSDYEFNSWVGQCVLALSENVEQQLRNIKSEQQLNVSHR